MAKVAVIGCGLVGRAWAISFARGGHQVALFDRTDGAAQAAIAFAASVLPDLERHDLLNGATPEQMLGRLSINASLADALKGAVHVQESTPENLAVKKAVFAELDALSDPDAVLASSTSAILPSAFSVDVAGRHRCLVVHPLNPPYLIPAAEIVPAPWTGSGAVERTRLFLSGCGQTPIVMKREIDGFVMNRLQGALLEEAFRLVSDGVAGIEDVDVGLREGLALRWSFMGPFETIDLNAPGGVGDYVRRYEHIYENLFPSMQHRADWVAASDAGIEAERRRVLPAQALGERHIWRDRQLMALAAHKRDMAKGKV